MNHMETSSDALIIDAAIFAHEAHINHKRKYTNLPYFTHLNEVADLVELAGGSSEMIAAAFLHDSVEDVGVTIDQIKVRFGDKVADLVGWLTDVSKPSDGNRAVRKEIDRRHTAAAPPDAQTIKLADLISNSISIVEHDKDFSIVYLREKELLLPYLKDGSKYLYEQACNLLIMNKLALFPLMEAKDKNV